MDTDQWQSKQEAPLENSTAFPPGSGHQQTLRQQLHPAPLQPKAAAHSGPQPYLHPQQAPFDWAQPAAPPQSEPVRHSSPALLSERSAHFRTSAAAAPSISLPPVATQPPSTQGHQMRSPSPATAALDDTPRPSVRDTGTPTEHTAEGSPHGDEDQDGVGVAAGRRRKASIKAKGSAGSAVWAKLADYPWWPAQVALRHFTCS